MRLTRSAVLVGLVAVIAWGSAGCSNPPAAPSNYAAFSRTDIIVGTGADAVPGRTLTIDYTGWFYVAAKADNKGLVFDTSSASSAFSFVLGTGSVIQGLEDGLVGMKVGGVRRLIVPPSMAYGAARSGPIPANSTLLFEVTLLKVE